MYQGTIEWPPSPEREDDAFLTEEGYKKYSVFENLYELLQEKKREIDEFSQSCPAEENLIDSCNASTPSQPMSKSQRKKANKKKSSTEVKGNAEETQSVFPSFQGNPTASANNPSHVESKPQMNHVELVSMAKFQHRPRLPNRSSYLTREEQQNYLDLYAKFLHHIPQRPTPEEVKEINIFKELQMKVATEQEEFMRFLEEAANQNSEDYTYIHPEVYKYTQAASAHRQKRVQNYPRYYTHCDSISLVPAPINPNFVLTPIATLLQLGQVSKNILPNMTQRAKPKLLKDNIRLSKRFPPSGVKPFTKNSTDKEVCSRDHNAETLAERYQADIVISASGLTCLIDNHSPAYANQWEMPVVVKEHKVIEKGEERVHKVVYIDKPFFPKTQTPRERNLWYSKFALKALLTHPNHVNVHRFNKKTNEGKTEKTEKPDQVSVAEDDKTPVTNEEEDMFGSGDASMVDLETFGSGGELLSSKPYQIQSLNKNTTPAVKLGPSKTNERPKSEHDLSAECKMDITANQKSADTGELQDTNEKTTENCVSDSKEANRSGAGTDEYNDEGEKKSGQIEDATTKDIKVDSEIKEKNRSYQDGHTVDHSKPVINRTSKLDVDCESSSAPASILNVISEDTDSNKSMVEAVEETKQTQSTKHQAFDTCDSSDSDNELVIDIDMKSPHFCSSPQRSPAVNVIRIESPPQSPPRTPVRTRRKHEISPIKSPDYVNNEEHSIPIIPTSPVETSTVFDLTTSVTDGAEYDCSNSIDTKNTMDTIPLANASDLSGGACDTVTVINNDQNIELTTSVKPAEKVVNETKRASHLSVTALPSLRRSTRLRCKSDMVTLGNNLTQVKTEPDAESVTPQNECVVILTNVKQTDTTSKASAGIVSGDEVVKSETACPQPVRWSLRSRRSLPANLTDTDEPPTKRITRTRSNTSAMSLDTEPLQQPVKRGRGRPRKVEVTTDSSKTEETPGHMENKEVTETVVSAISSYAQCENNALNEISADHDCVNENTATSLSTGNSSLVEEDSMVDRPKQNSDLTESNDCAANSNTNNRIGRRRTSRESTLNLIHNKVGGETSLCYNEDSDAKVLNETVKKTVPKMTSRESRRTSSGQPATGTTLDEIMKMQEKMLGSQSASQEQKSNMNVSHDKNPPVEPVRQVVPPAGENTHQPATATHCWQNMEDPSDFKSPEEDNLVYSLWQFGGMKLLIRYGIHGCRHDPKHKQVHHVCVTSKLEYQPTYGYEQVTVSETSRAWMASYIRNNCNIIRARINVFTSEVLMVEDLDQTKILHPRCNFNPASSMTSVYNILERVSKLPVGHYLLSHTVGNTHCHIKKSTEHKGGVYDLHISYNMTETPSQRYVQWIPIDPSIMLPFHIKYKRIPATFEPRATQQQQKQQKRKGNKGKKKKQAQKSLTFEEQLKQRKKEQSQ